MIPLECGDPAQGPASYTRFMLPFRYRRKEWRGAVNGPVFQEEKAVLRRQWRERYLTDETADVLFRRARWFALRENGQDWRREGICMEFREGKMIPVSMATPWLVLFEWPKAREGKGDVEDYYDVLWTGFLLIDLHFPKEVNGRPDLDDLLKLNELFRYWQRLYEGHERAYRSFLGPWPVDPRYPGSLIGNTGNDEDTITRIYLDRWAGFMELPVIDKDGKPWRLFPNDWSDEARAWAQDPSPYETGKTGWITYADNRAFTWTCAIVKDGGGALRRQFCLHTGKPWEFGHWVKLLNVDRPGDNSDATHKGIMQFERDWAKDRTYRRWEEWGTFYGFNYHAGAMLGPPLNEPDSTPIWRHFGEIYFDMVLLLLYVRVTLFRFSLELNRISAEARDTGPGGGQKRWRERYQSLRWCFALFTNLYQFPLLSNQQQGIEMYSLARKIMDVDELFREVKEEIESSHEFLATEEARDMAQTTARLTVVATVGLILAIAVGFLGMNVLVKDLGNWFGEWWIFGVTVLVAFIILVASISFSRPLSKRIDWLSDRGPK